MFNRFFILFICGFLFVSCNFFKKKKFINKSIIDTVIDYNSVDTFPLFPKCEEIIEVEDQQICSQIKLSEHIKASLMYAGIQTSKSINDTIIVSLIINKKGEANLLNLKSSDYIKIQIPNIDSLILSGINNLPKLKPAIKRGIPVATEFSLPIVVKN